MTAFNRFLNETFDKGLVGAEIGVRDGAHALQLLASNNMEKLYLVDSFLPYQDATVRAYNEQDQKSEYQKLKKNMKPHKKKTEIMKISSKEAMGVFKENGIKLDFVYIDANHAYENIKEDLKWWEFVKVGGVMGGHDYTKSHGCGGVILAVDEFVKEEKVELFTEISRGTVEWAIIKTKK